LIISVNINCLSTYWVYT